MWPKELIDRKSAIDIVNNLKFKMLRVLNESFKGSDVLCALEAAKRELEKLVYYIPDEFYPEWRNPETDPPKVETEVLVLVDCGKGYCITTAFYEDGTVSQHESVWQWEDVDDYGIYDEEEDLYRLAKGWWEYRHFTPEDALECPIDKPVVGWMPLPPKEVKQQ